MTVTVQLKKKCKKCKTEKFLDEFYMRNDRPNGLGRHSYCVVCEKKRNRENYLNRRK